MYLPSHFETTDAPALRRLVAAYPLGALVTHGADGLDADHLPFEFDPDAGAAGVLRAHVARANPLWRRCTPGMPAMVIFRGPEAFVSPSWYPSKQQTHRQVPTWNYEVVHAHGVLSVHDDERWVRALVARLTRHHEAAEPRPWKMGDAPAAFIDELLRSIVGIEVAVTRLVGKSKLSQNKSAADREGAAQALAERGHAAIARRMREAP